MFRYENLNDSVIIWEIRKLQKDFMGYVPKLKYTKGKKFWEKQKDIEQEKKKINKKHRYKVRRKRKILQVLKIFRGRGGRTADIIQDVAKENIPDSIFLIRSAIVSITIAGIILLEYLNTYQYEFYEGKIKFGDKIIVLYQLLLSV